MSSDTDIRKPFLDFAGHNGSYYADVFLKIQKATLGRGHVNVTAMIGSFVWAALRGGGRVLIHCRAGRGRSGMIALRLMIAGGERPVAALKRLRAVQPEAVETPGQMNWATGKHG